MILDTKSKKKILNQPLIGITGKLAICKINPVEVHQTRFQLKPCSNLKKKYRKIDKVIYNAKILRYM